MIFKIKSEEEVKKEPEIELRLEKMSGFVQLRGRDDNGDMKVLMEFQDGKFHRLNFAQLEGLETDEEGRIGELKL